MFLRSVSLTAILLTCGAEVVGQDLAATGGHICEIGIPDPAADRRLAATERRLAPQKKRYEALKVEAENILRDMPQSKLRDDMEKNMAELAKVFASYERSKDLPPLCPVASASSKAYVREMVRRIEECGTRNFPKEQGRSLYGSASIVFTLGIDGAIESIDIGKSSGSATIDQHSVALLQSSAPFGPVPYTIHEGRFTHFFVNSGFNFRRDQNHRKPPEPKLRCSYR